MAELDLTGEGPDAETFVDGYADAVARAHDVATKAMLRLKPAQVSAGTVESAHDDLQTVVGAAGRSGFIQGVAMAKCIAERFEAAATAAYQGGRLGADEAAYKGRCAQAFAKVLGLLLQHAEEAPVVSDEVTGAITHIKPEQFAEAIEGVLREEFGV
jgi:hypothetical protein